MLSGKVALVTGASRGIGAAVARKLASQGAAVAVIYSGNTEAANAVVEEITATYGVNAKAYQCDVASLEQCSQVVKQVSSELGAVDILVNNAGVTRDNLLALMSEDEFDKVIDTNLKGAFNMTKACVRGFIKKKQGRIINISSVSGLSGIAGQSNYSASKAGVIGLTKAVAKELASKNVTCNAIAPGFIETDMTKGLDAESFVKAIPLSRLGKPEDIASLAAFLASDSASYITGEVIRVDGGLAM